jgi:hypothetical protein
VAGTWLQDWHLPRHQGWTYRAPVSRTETWSVSPSVGMLPFGVTVPATVPQRSEIPEELMNYPVFLWYALERRSRQTQKGQKEKYVRWQKGRAETKIIIRQYYTFSSNNIYFYEILKLGFSIGESNTTTDLRSFVFRAIRQVPICIQTSAL